MSASDLDRIVDEAARKREQLLVALRAAQAAREAASEAATKAARWTVVEQFGHLPDKVFSTHRWAWLAERAAHRARRVDARRHSAAYRAHYTVRRAS